MTKQIVNLLCSSVIPNTDLVFMFISGDINGNYLSLIFNHCFDVDYNASAYVNGIKYSGIAMRSNWLDAYQIINIGTHSWEWIINNLNLNSRDATVTPIDYYNHGQRCSILSKSDTSVFTNLSIKNRILN